MALEWRIEKDLVDYTSAVSFMQNRVEDIIKGTSSELVWLLEHPSLYTAGNGAQSDELLANSDSLPVFSTGRGGKYTYHGPGQRVIYLMLNLKKRNICDIRAYILKLGCWIVSVLEYFSIKSEFDSDRIGVWIVNGIFKEKVAAFGIRIKHWVTYHGIAVNIFPNLEYYKSIVPCGLKDFGVTSMHKLGVDISMKEFDLVLYHQFCKFF